MFDAKTIWYVIARKDNDYPLIIYADEELAQQVACANGQQVVPVVPLAVAVDQLRRAQCRGESS